MSTGITFKELMTEGSVKAKLFKKYSNDDIIHIIEESPDNVYLKMILVPFKKRRKGIATRFIKDLQSFAKEAGKTVTLVPSDMYAEQGIDMDLNQLRDWYGRLGFKEMGDFKRTMIWKP